MKKTQLTVIGAFALIIGSCVTGCKGGSGGSENNVGGGDTLTCEATLLTIVDHGDYTTATIANPWDSTAGDLQTLVLVAAGKPKPADLPGGTVITVPLGNSIVYSSVHASAIDELGAIGAVKGVCDASYFKIPAIVKGLADGSVVDAGNSMSPSVEQIMLLGPEAILKSPYQNAASSGIEATGAPIVECADYMESTPLGRAEWIKLLGELYGKRAEAAAIYQKVVEEYNAIRSKAAEAETRPTVISETVTDGVWYMPGGDSYMARLFADAGGDYPWSDDNTSGSLPLDFATVYDRASEADVWLVKTYGNDMTLDGLRSISPLNERFKAFKAGGVYACNTATSPLFEEFPFHPEKLLREYYNIFHPSADRTLTYYRQVDR